LPFSCSGALFFFYFSPVPWPLPNLLKLTFFFFVPSLCIFFSSGLCFFLSDRASVFLPSPPYSCPPWCRFFLCFRKKNVENWLFFLPFLALVRPPLPHWFCSVSPPKVVLSGVFCFGFCECGGVGTYFFMVFPKQILIF